MKTPQVLYQCWIEGPSKVNTETSDNALQYSGGLNGPKSTGQSTVPVLASQLRRQVSMEESAKVEQNLLNLYRTFGK